MSVDISVFNEGIRDELPGCPDFLISRYAVRGVIEFCRETHYFERIFEQTVYAEQRDTFFNDQVLLTAGVLGAGKRPTFLKQLRFGSRPLSCYYVEVDTDITDLGTIAPEGKGKFYNFPDSQSISVFPVKADEFSDGELKVVAKCVFEPTETISKVEEQLFRDARDAVEGYAVYELAKKPGRDWASREVSMMGWKQFWQSVNAYRIRKNELQHNQQMQVRMRPFI